MRFITLKQYKLGREWIPTFELQLVILPAKAFNDLQG